MLEPEPIAEMALRAELSRRGERVAYAESCTGGLLAARATDLPGSSAWFECGLVTYSNQAKQELLGVPADLIAEHGAVSQACAVAMVTGLLSRTAADWGIAVTGIAGPDGGCPEKPVGTVWIACSGRRGPPVAQCHTFDGDRTSVRRQSADAAVAALVSLIRSAPA